MSTILPILRILYVRVSSKASVALRAALETVVGTEAKLREASSAFEGVDILQNETFDAVLVHHAPPKLDALNFVSGCRTSGVATPMIVLGSVPEARILSAARNVGVDEYVLLSAATPVDLLWKISRAVKYTNATRECRELREKLHKIVLREANENIQFLEEQAQISTPGVAIEENESGGSALADVSREYSALLRRYIPMESEYFGPEVCAFARKLSQSGASIAEFHQIHVRLVLEMLRTLDAKRSRWLMNRAQMLFVETLIAAFDHERAGRE
ncbi:MAG: hypothetical protein Q4D38_04270 [Planctomycetia bacterium]|nr:hypothetical protein [Planctomycetia bacterium]